MRYRIILTISLVFVALSWIGCQKEYSLEDNGGNPGGGNPPLGNNCRVEQIIAADSATGIGLYSLLTNFNSSNVPVKVVAYDSVQLTADLVIDLYYSGDTILIGSSNDFYITDGSKRIKEFHTYEDPADTSTDKIVYTYTYDASGYLSNKVVSIESIPVPIAQFDYTWSGGNLIKIDGYVPALSQKILIADLEYDASKTAKNFIPIFPDGFEFAPYILAFDLGKKSTNLVKKITMQVYNSSGTLDQTLVTTFKDYVFSSDGYLLEWFGTGDNQAAVGLLSGRTKFKYHCN